MPNAAVRDDRKWGERDFPKRSVLSRIRQNLLRWYSKHARDLPWRRSRDPYRIWISEIMLQQTTVVAVVPYFERFLSRFPTVRDLADADEHDVLRLWEGLGYYSRARNLRRAARQIVDQHDGTIPRTVAQLVALSGIGRYTAGAIASFAYDEPAPIVEANTLRVYSRLLGYRGDVYSSAGNKLIWSFAEELVPRRSSGIFNQALMDLGALVCTPTNPDCPACPARACCRAFRDGEQNEIPRPKPRPATTYLTHLMIAVHDRGRYLLRQSPPGERWAGLWEFLRVDCEDHSSQRGLSDSTRSRYRTLPLTMRRRVRRAVSDLCGLIVEADDGVFEFSHTVTRFRIQLICLTAERLGGKLKTDSDFRWVTPQEFSQHALSMPARRFALQLAARRPTHKIAPQNQ